MKLILLSSLNLYLLAMDWMKSSCCLMDGHRLSSLTPSAYTLAADCTADIGFPCPSHFGEFESQSSMIHFAVLPGNWEKKNFCQRSIRFCFLFLCNLIEHSSGKLLLLFRIMEATLIYLMPMRNALFLLYKGYREPEIWIPMRTRCRVSGGWYFSVLFYIRKKYSLKNSLYIRMFINHHGIFQLIKS